jgi:hypothetical protein
MIIHLTGTGMGLHRLIQGGLVRVVDTDEWSVTVEVRGLTDAGDAITFRIGMSRNEVAMIARASRKHD